MKRRRVKKESIRDAIKNFCLENNKRAWTILEMTECILGHVTPSTKKTLKDNFNMVRPILRAMGFLVLNVENKKGIIIGWRFANENDPDIISQTNKKINRARGYQNSVVQDLSVIKEKKLLPVEDTKELFLSYTPLSVPQLSAPESH